MKYPNPTQVEASKLVEAALSVAAWPDMFSLGALTCAADYLERQVAGCRTESANAVLKAIAKHYRNEAQDALPNVESTGWFGADEAWERLCVHLTGEHLEADWRTGSFNGQKNFMYFGCGDGRCDDWWEGKEAFMEEHGDTLFRILPNNPVHRPETAKGRRFSETSGSPISTLKTMKSTFLSNLHHAYAQTDGTYAFPNSREGDMLKTAKREIEELHKGMRDLHAIARELSARLEAELNCPPTVNKHMAGKAIKRLTDFLPNSQERALEAEKEAKEGEGRPRSTSSYQTEAREE